MDRMIIKMAQRLNSYDEASLMNLWHDYAQAVQSFEPTREWEEKALALCLVQAVAWKNQLFNYNLSLSQEPGEENGLPFFIPSFKNSSEKDDEEEGLDEVKKKATILDFPTK